MLYWTGLKDIGSTGLKEFFSKKSVVKTLDIMIFVSAVLGFALIIAKPAFELITKTDYPVNLNWVVVLMMSVVILLLGLKMLGDKHAKLALQLIMFAMVILAISMVTGIAKLVFEGKL